MSLPWRANTVRPAQVPWNHTNVHALTLRPMKLETAGDLKGDRVTDSGFVKLFNGLRVDEASPSVCTEADRLIRHPVVLVRRKDAFSPFHAHEGLLAVWNTYLALDLDPCETGILLSDHIHDTPSIGNPFLELHRRLFAPVHGVERVSELGLRQTGTCYQRLIVSQDPSFCFDIPYGKKDKVKVACGRSPWLVGFSRFALHSFGIPYGARRERRLPHVTFPSRLTYKRAVGGHAGLFETMRTMENRMAFAKAIRRLCMNRGDESSGGAGASDGGRAAPEQAASSSDDVSDAPAGITLAGEGERRCTFSQSNFASMPVAEQVSLASHTDVMVGTHGSSFTFMIYMPPHGVILEVVTRTDWHHSNTASYLGLTHKQLTSLTLQHMAKSYVLDVDEAIRGVAAAVDQVTPHVRRGPVPHAAPAPLSPRSNPWPAVMQFD